MKFIQTPLEGLIVIEPDCYQDQRGFFLETYQELRYKDAGITEHFVQDNQSRSTKGVLRGMHFLKKDPQAQLLNVMRGAIFDVCVDVREDSDTFGQWYGAELSEQGPARQVYMAPGFAHGFCVLSDYADLHYKVSRFYDPTAEGGLIWNDPDVAIDWPCVDPIINQKDLANPRLAEL